MRSSPLNNQRTSLEDIELVDSGNSSPSTSLSHTRASIAAKSVIFANALAASKKDKKLAECSKPVQCFFSPIYFLISFILEILPEYTMSPLFAIFWYGYKKGLNVIRHRYLFPRGDSKAIPLSLMLILWVLDTCQWIAAYKFFTESEKMRKNGIDLAEFVVFMVTIALRSAVISTKYAYFSKEELQALLSPNGWDDVKAAKKMLLAGWCGNPRSSELLEECLETACDAASVNLSKATFTMVSPCGTSQKIISAKHLMGRIVYKCFGEPLGNTSKSRWCWVFLCALSPNLLRWTTANPWGEGNFETNFVVLVFFATNIIFGFNTLAFVVCSEHDFKRRRKAACLLSDLISSGGVAVEDFFSNNGRESAGDVIIKSDCLKRSDFSNFGKVFFDIRDANNAYSWMLLRSSLRIYGANYYERCQVSNQKRGSPAVLTFPHFKNRYSPFSCVNLSLSLSLSRYSRSLNVALYQLLSRRGDSLFGIRKHSVLGANAALWLWAGSDGLGFCERRCCLYEEFKRGHRITR